LGHKKGRKPIHERNYKPDILTKFFSDAKNYEAGNANQAGVLVAPVAWTTLN
jgi:hypothetical protein